MHHTAPLPQSYISPPPRPPGAEIVPYLCRAAGPRPSIPLAHPSFACNTESVAALEQTHINTPSFGRQGTLCFAESLLVVFARSAAGIAPNICNLKTWHAETTGGLR